MCHISSRTQSESDDLTAAYYPSLKAAGWTPPSTIGGTWCRVSPEGIYETWPKTETNVEIVHSDSMVYLRDPIALQKPSMPLGYNLLDTTLW